MQTQFQPIIHKTRLQQLALHVARSGLCLNDTVELQREGDDIVVLARLHRPFLGLIPRRRQTRLGLLGPHAVALVAPLIDRDAPLRARIVGLTPEHLAGATGPEVHVSVWSVPEPVLFRPPPFGQVPGA